MARRLLIVGAVLAAMLVGGASLIRFAGSGATEFMVQGPQLHLSGTVTGASTERFERLLEQHPALDTLVLGDIPGTDDLNWLIAIGYMVRRAGLATEAQGTLHNDAILIWLAGQPRGLGPDAALLWSNARFARTRGLPFDESAVAAQERRAYIEEMTGDVTVALFLEAAREQQDMVVLRPEQFPALASSLD